MLSRGAPDATALKRKMEEATNKGRGRRQIAILLRAKLELARQAAQHASIHRTEEPTNPKPPC